MLTFGVHFPSRSLSHGEVGLAQAGAILMRLFKGLGGKLEPLVPQARAALTGFLNAQSCLPFVSEDNS